MTIPSHTMRLTAGQGQSCLQTPAEGHEVQSIDYEETVAIVTLTKNLSTAPQLASSVAHTPNITQATDTNDSLV